MTTYQTFLERLNQLDGLLRRKCTGTPDTLAEKLNMSRSNWFKLKGFLERELQVSLVYNRNLQSYHYKEEGKLIIGFQKTFLPKKE